MRGRYGTVTKLPIFVGLIVAAGAAPTFGQAAIPAAFGPGAVRIEPVKSPLTTTQPRVLPASGAGSGRIPLGGHIVFKEAALSYNPSTAIFIKKAFTADEILAHVPPDRLRVGRVTGALTPGDIQHRTGKIPTLSYDVEVRTGGVPRWVPLSLYVDQLNQVETWLNGLGRTLRDGPYALPKPLPTAALELGLRFTINPPAVIQPPPPAGNQTKPGPVVIPGNEPVEGFAVQVTSLAQGGFPPTVNGRPAPSVNIPVPGAPGVTITELTRPVSRAALAAGGAAPARAAGLYSKIAVARRCGATCAIKFSDVTLTDFATEILNNTPVDQGSAQKICAHPDINQAYSHQPDLPALFPACADHFHSMYARPALAELRKFVGVMRGDQLKAYEQDVVKKKIDVNDPYFTQLGWDPNNDEPMIQAFYQPCLVRGSLVLASPGPDGPYSTELFDLLYATPVSHNSAGEQDVTTGTLAGNFYDGVMHLHDDNIADCMGKSGDWFGASLCLNYSSDNDYSQASGFDLVEQAGLAATMKILGFNLDLLNGDASTEWKSGALSPTNAVSVVSVPNNSSTLNPVDNVQHFDGPSATFAIGPVPIQVTSFADVSLTLNAPNTAFNAPTPTAEGLLSEGVAAHASADLGMAAAVDLLIASAGVAGKFTPFDGTASGNIGTDVNTAANVVTVNKTYNLSASMYGDLYAFVEIDLVVYTKRWELELVHISGPTETQNSTGLLSTAHSVVPQGAVSPCGGG